MSRNAAGAPLARNLSISSASIRLKATSPVDRSRNSVTHCAVGSSFSHAAHTLGVPAKMFQADPACYTNAPDPIMLVYATPHTPGTKPSGDYACISAIPHTPGTYSSGDYARISAIPTLPAPTLPAIMLHICDPPHSRQTAFWRLWGHLALLRRTSVGLSADSAAGAESGSVLRANGAAGVVRCAARVELMTSTKKVTVKYTFALRLAEV